MPSSSLNRGGKSGVEKVEISTPVSKNPKHSPGYVTL